MDWRRIANFAVATEKGMPWESATVPAAVKIGHLVWQLRMAIVCLRAGEKGRSDDLSQKTCRRLIYVNVMPSGVRAD